MRMFRLTEIAAKGNSVRNKNKAGKSVGSSEACVERSKVQWGGFK